MIRMKPGAVNVLEAVCSCGRVQACSNWTTPAERYARAEEITGFLERCGWQIIPTVGALFEESDCVCPFCSSLDRQG